MTRPIIQSDGLTVSDHGKHLVVERWEDGRVGSWIADRGENDGVSVMLSEDDRRRVAAFLLEGLA